MLGIIPAAGRGSRIQPLGFSKELLPVGSSRDGSVERPRAVCDYLLDRFSLAGVQRLCFVIGPGKGDILEYIGADYAGIPAAFVVQPSPAGLCDAVFRAAPLASKDEPVCIGLPDTIWFPSCALRMLDRGRFSCLLFPVEQPQFFDAVALDDEQRIVSIEVKSPTPSTHWIWGAMQMPGATFLELRDLWEDRERQDEYLGTLINAWLAEGGEAFGVKAGTSYFDVGTMRGFRAALSALSTSDAAQACDSTTAAEVRC